MATDKDPYALGQSINMLNGNRWVGGLIKANKQYMIPESKWNDIKNDPKEIIPILKYFLTQHYQYQLPRILELERYYKGENDIHFANINISSNRADNRVTAGFPKFITNTRVGYSVGNPIKFQYNEDKGKDDDLEEALAEFNSQNDEEYHEKVMKKNLSVTGRAYELEYIKQDTNEVAIRPIDPANAFVVYDTTIEQHSLFAVRYYLIDYQNQPKYYAEVYTDDSIYYFSDGKTPGSNLKLDNAEEHYFFSVPLTEYINNDERMGDWEASLDKIDAVDKAVSEMANSQEDFANAILKIVGDFDVTDSNGNTSEHPQIDRKNAIMWLKPEVRSDINGSSSVITPDAGYITKDVNVSEWKVYVDWLSAQIHKDTNTPDTSDENFASNSSGVAILYKLWGSDQERSIQESLYTRGLMRRLRVLGNYLEVTGQISSADDVENYKILYTPNLPKNDTETLQNAQVLANLGTESKQTIREVVQKYTGINSDTEEQRVEDEDKKDLDADPMQQVFKRVPDNSNENEPKDDDSKKADNPSMLDKIKGFFGGGK
ncbi:phage portal protein [Companilactobacillus pabuli]|uniref:Phage portal protein n=1 Tax=Companilactobacillus pabuli TaxID=2714036 RepID=A0A7L7KXY6_9LACO|nr:phage portal protein [Companilactobacillus pabuli]QMT84212.1 phage portal protein [Companilactobacillus pabuli]